MDRDKMRKEEFLLYKVDDEEVSVEVFSGMRVSD